MIITPNALMNSGLQGITSVSGILHQGLNHSPLLSDKPGIDEQTITRYENMLSDATSKYLELSESDKQLVKEQQIRMDDIVIPRSEYEELIGKKLSDEEFKEHVHTLNQFESHLSKSARESDNKRGESENLFPNSEVNSITVESIDQRNQQRQWG